MVVGLLIKCVPRMRRSAWRRGIVAVILATALLFIAFNGSRSSPGPGPPITEPVICKATFGPTQADDLRKVASYRFPGSDRYIRLLFPHHEELLQSHSIKHQVLATRNVTFPIIVTGADYSHFKESLNMVRNLTNGVRQTHKEIRLIYFDLGLSSYQRQQMRAICDCDLRLFPFNDFPPHVRILQGYAWKSIGLQIILNEYPFVVWMDASVRFKTADLTWLFKAAKQQGVLTGEGGMSIAARTRESLFKFLREEPCLYRTHEIEGGFIAVYDSEFVRRYFMQTLVSCALTMGCMMPDVYPLRHLFCPNSTHYYGCHRYDQSVMGILMNRLFHGDLEKHMTNHDFYEFRGELELHRYPLLPDFINDLINS